ncbi:Threonyl/alanyl tRNA synthetase SAD, partial [mine drainage metagenome]
RDEALSIPNLARTKPGRELISSLETVRVVEITGLDMQADGGTHVKNLSEVGKLKFAKMENKGKNNKRVYFTLE